MPFVPVAARVTSVRTVTESVPYLYRELFSWPCLSGEPLAPSLASAAGYAVFKGLPAVAVPGTSLGTPSSATWRQCGRPDDKTYLELTSYVRVAAGGINGLTMTHKANLAAETVPTRVLGLTFSQGNATSYTGVGAGLTALPAAYDWATWIAAWRKVVYQLSSTFARIVIDDVTVADLTPSQAALVVPSSIFSCGLYCENQTTGGAASPILYASGVQAKWL